ncbi:MAG: hypothetical protein V4582_13570 [Pseudomonadota bacterium]
MDTRSHFILALCATLALAGGHAAAAGAPQRVPVRAGVLLQAAPAAGTPPSGLLAARTRWEGEDAACSARAPVGTLAVLGGYQWKVEPGGEFMRRSYGARLHLFDTRSGKALRTIVFHELAEGGRGAAGISAPIACAFTPDGQRLIALSGSKLALYGVENGYLLGAEKFHLGADQAELKFYKVGQRQFVRVSSARLQADFALDGP